MNFAKILTIDGASGVGKGTIAKIIAKKKHWNLLDSGSIYRAFALSVQTEKNLNKSLLIKYATNLDLVFSDDDVILNSKKVNTIIRTEAVGNLASKLAKLDYVRQALLQKQRDFASEKGLVADGRDMATVVFPQAHYQVFLTASIQIRVDRRVKQLQIKRDQRKIDKIFNYIRERDIRDINRASSPLMPSKNAYIIDTSDLSIVEVVNKITNYMQDKKN